MNVLVRRGLIAVVLVPHFVAGCGGTSEHDVPVCKNAWREIRIPSELSDFKAAAAVWHEEKLYLFKLEPEGGDPLPDAPAGLVFEQPARFRAISSEGRPDLTFLSSALRVGHEIVVTAAPTYFDSEPNELVFGGRYDTVSDTWTLLPPLARQELSEVVAAPMGEQMLVIHHSPSGAEPSESPEYLAWAPETSWRALSAPSAPGIWSGSVWTGQQVILWDMHSYNEPGAPIATRYDPAGDAWLPVSAAGAPSFGGQNGAWTGSELVTPGGRYYPDRDAWEPMDEAGATMGVPIAVGRRVVFWTLGTIEPPYDSFEAQGAVYDAEDDRWGGPITDRCLEPTGTSAAQAWIGDGLFVWVSNGWDAPDRAWFLRSEAVFGELSGDPRECTCPPPLAAD